MNRRSREKESCDVQEEEELLCCIYKQSVGVSLRGSTPRRCSLSRGSGTQHLKDTSGSFTSFIIELNPVAAPGGGHTPPPPKEQNLI